MLRYCRGVISCAFSCFSWSVICCDKKIPTRIWLNGTEDSFHSAALSPNATLGKLSPS